MTSLRVTAESDRAPFIVHKRGLSLAEQVQLAAAATRAGLSAAGVGWSAEHPARVVDLFVDLGWDLDADAQTDRALAGPWDARAADLAGEDWAAPGDHLVRAQGCEPRPYQITGSHRLYLSPGGLILADSPGLGKTLQECMAWPAGAAVNVACPRNAVPTWEDEVKRWRPDLAVRSLKKRGSATPAEPGEVAVGTLESLPALEWSRRGAIAPGAFLVCDEAHSLKGESAQAGRFRTWSDAVRAARGSVHLLTGTPVLNADPNELWRLLDACGRAYDTLGPQSNLPALFKHTVDRVFVPKRRRGSGKPITVDAGAGLAAVSDETIAATMQQAGEFVERVTWTGEHVAWVDAALAKAIVRRTKEAVAKDLPAIIYQDVRVSVPRGVLEDYTRADAARRLDAGLAALERAIEAGAREDEIDRLSANPAVATVRKLLAAAKVAATMDLLDDLKIACEPSLVFSSHQKPVQDVGARTGWAWIDGDVTGDRRGHIRKDFQAGTWTAKSTGRGYEGPADGVAMSIRAASESLTLTRAAHVIFIDEDFVPARNTQAVARSHRIGQTRTVNVIRLVADHPVDRRIAAILAAKSRFANALLAGIENRD